MGSHHVLMPPSLDLSPDLQATVSNRLWRGIIGECLRDHPQEEDRMEPEEGCAEMRVTRPPLIPQASEARMALQSCPKKRPGGKTLHSHMGQWWDKTAPGKGRQPLSPEGEGVSCSGLSAGGSMRVPDLQRSYAWHTTSVSSPQEGGLSGSKSIAELLPSNLPPAWSPPPAQPRAPTFPRPPGENRSKSCQLQQSPLPVPTACHRP